jgi:heme/copper-type cytochrome/quinol oxidase subunit 3
MTGKQLYPVPRRTASIGMLLFLASLSMLFLSGMLGYFVIRIRSSIPAGELHFSPMLWISTAAIITSSITMSIAFKAVRRERLARFRTFLLITLALAILFVGIQTPALINLLHVHFALSEGGNKLYGMVFFLILLHAMHVLGGLIGLGGVVAGAFGNRYDHESYTSVQNVTWYWHFLDAVWLVMFLSMTALG